MTERLLGALGRRDPHELGKNWPIPRGPLDDDGQLALYCCYELHYRGLPAISDWWEWEPSLLEFRRTLESRFEEELTEAVGPIETEADLVVSGLWELATSDNGPSLSAWLLEHGSLDHARELAVHRSAYQLKEADPHTWAIPRLEHDAKAKMVAIQAGEYGDGVAPAMHAVLFASTMEMLGLDSTYNAYLDHLPGTTLATTNLISFLGLHRRHRGALVGHLALFEMTSVGPMGRYARWMESLGIGPAGLLFYEVHVAADEHHQHLAAAMVADLVSREPELARSVLFGARALGAVERRFADRMLTSWQSGRTSLRRCETVAPCSPVLGQF